MTIGTALKAFSGIALFPAVVVAAMLPAVGPAGAQPEVRDHRSRPPRHPCHYNCAPNPSGGTTVNGKETPMAPPRTSGEAGTPNPVVRDHRTTPAWQPDVAKNKKDQPVIRDHRSPPTWQPGARQTHWPHEPYDH
jgi:hypothetical protein